MSVKKFKQTFEVTYKYFNDNKTVVAYVTPTKSIDSCFYSMLYVGDLYKQTYKGVSTYKEGDNFDIETAKQVAKRKAIRSYYKAVKNSIYERFECERRKLCDSIAVVKQIEKKINTLTEEIKGE